MRKKRKALKRRIKKAERNSRMDFAHHRNNFSNLYDA